MMNKGIYVLIGSLLISLGTVLYVQLTKPKLGYVKTAELFEGYLGMREAKRQYSQQVSGWQSNLDTLGKDYRRALSAYELEMPRLNKQAKQEREQLLGRQAKSIEDYQASLQERMVQEDKRLTEGVVNQVNAYVAEYGEKNGYTLVMGTTNGGNILYGAEATDITDEVLKGLNSRYQGKEK